jgi:hypothetical protein
VNEMQQLEAMCAAVPPPDEDILARARARVLSDASPASYRPQRSRRALRVRGRGGRAPGRLITMPRLALAGGLAAAAAAAVTAVLVSPAAPGPVTRIRLDAAAVVLHRAAAAALAAPAPRSGQFLYIGVRGVGPRGTNSYRQQMWLPASNGVHPGTVVQTPCREPAMGRPCTFFYGQVRGDWYAPTYAWLKLLRSAPGTLLSNLAKHSPCTFSVRHVDTPHAAYSEVYNILSTVYVLPPASGSALFNAAAQIPGVTVLRHVRDAAGGRGIAVALTGRATAAAPASPAPLGPLLRYELIFHRHSYRFLGLQEVTPGGTVEHAETVTSARVADGAPKTTSHTLWGGLTFCIA